MTRYAYRRPFYFPEGVGLLKSSHIQAIYSAKRTILHNEQKIIDLIKRQRQDEAKFLQEMNESLKRSILKKYGIILD